MKHKRAFAKWMNITFGSIAPLKKTYTAEDMHKAFERGREWQTLNNKENKQNDSQTYLFSEDTERNTLSDL